MSASHEEETPGDLQGMIQAYLWCGLGGLAVGIIAALVLVQVGPDFLRASPVPGGIAIVLVSTIASSMAGGLLTLSPFAKPIMASAPTDDRGGPTT